MQCCIVLFSTTTFSVFKNLHATMSHCHNTTNSGGSRGEGVRGEGEGVRVKG